MNPGITSRTIACVIVLIFAATGTLSSQDKQSKAQNESDAGPTFKVIEVQQTGGFAGVNISYRITPDGKFTRKSARGGAEGKLNAEEISDTLKIARSNTSNSLKELLGWKLIRRAPVMGDRRDHYEAEVDLWQMLTRIAQGRKRKAQNPGFYNWIEQNYGVPAGVIIAIHGMETGFGGFMGDSSVVSAIVTLTYDCRRSDFFRPHAIGALKLVDRGSITINTRGAKHGELGHTQFLPGNALTYGVDGNGDGRVDFYNQADALVSTANFLRRKGWQPGAGYQQGQPNFRVIKQWNAATVYQQAIAIMGAKIDG